MKVHVVNGVPSGNISKVAVIVDVFRASSTIATALANGAESVIPFSNIRNAIRFVNAAKHRRKVVLAGERFGITPKGFDYGASPFEMSRENIENVTIAYSSTNLTRILSRIRGRSKILIGCLNNAEAIASHILKTHSNAVTIVVCGRKQGPFIEDLAGAGAIIDSLAAKDLTDDALVAVGLYRNPNWRSFAERGRVAERLRSLGFDKDIGVCLAVNTTSVVPGLTRNKLVDLRPR